MDMYCKIVSVDMTPERAETFLRFCQFEYEYKLIAQKILEAKPEQITNGRITIFVKNGEWQRTQIIEEKG
jgi:hypothetical protein